MKRKAVAAILFFFIIISPLSAYKILYAEQFYKLYHEHLLRYPERILENIVWLEQALKSDFCNPLYALAAVDIKEKYPRYKYLFSMHVNLLIVKEYRKIADKFTKHEAYFYNYPWKDQNIDSLDLAEEFLKMAYFYWDESVRYSNLINGESYFFTELQNWEDENYRIQNGELDYKFILDRDLQKIRDVRAAFEAMDENTY